MGRAQQVSSQRQLQAMAEAEQRLETAAAHVKSLEDAHPEIVEDETYKEKLMGLTRLKITNAETALLAELADKDLAPAILKVKIASIMRPLPIALRSGIHQCIRDIIAQVNQMIPLHTKKART